MKHSIRLIKTRANHCDMVALGSVLSFEGGLIVDNLNSSKNGAALAIIAINVGVVDLSDEVFRLDVNEVVELDLALALLRVHDLSSVVFLIDLTVEEVVGNDLLTVGLGSNGDESVGVFSDVGAPVDGGSSIAGLAVEVGAEFSSANVGLASIEESANGVRVLVGKINLSGNDDHVAVLVENDALCQAQYAHEQDQFHLYFN